MDDERCPCGAARDAEPCFHAPDCPIAQRDREQAEEWIKPHRGEAMRKAYLVHLTAGAEDAVIESVLIRGQWVPIPYDLGRIEAGTSVTFKVENGQVAIINEPAE